MEKKSDKQAQMLRLLPSGSRIFMIFKLNIDLFFFFFDVIKLYTNM